MRIFGILLILLGFLICLTIIGIPFGLGLMFVGAICVAFGGRRRTVITNVVQVSTTPGMQQAQIPADESRRDTARYIDQRPSEPRLLNPAPAWNTKLIEHVPDPRSRGEYAYDRNKWVALVQYDEDIKRIVDALAPYGEKYIDQFAVAFLALNDKEYLPMIVKKILETARRDAAGTKAR